VRGPLRLAAYRRLLAVRLAGQFGDGAFQASLAGAVLFNPERAAHASDIAAGFAVLLLPYSFIGPFAGVLIDRWSRQRILLIANLVRAVAVIGVAAEIGADWGGTAFYASALVALSVNRFVLSSLSAALPHVVDRDTLVGANAVSTTAGALLTTAGGAIAIGLRSLSDGSGGNGGYAVIAGAAAVPYVLAALAALRFTAPALGPDLVERDQRETLAAVARGLLAGAQHIRSRPPVLLALTTIGVHRFCYGVGTICTLLLYRNYFTDHGVLRAGLAGLGQIVVMVAVGGGLAALVTPTATRRFGLVRYPVGLLLLAAVAQAGLGLPFTQISILAASFVLGFVAQAVKISVDTTVQQGIDDVFRGRVFSLYDTLFNLTFVSAACLTAIVLPENGRSPVGVAAIAVGYLLIGLWYASRSHIAVMPHPHAHHPKQDDPVVPAPPTA
jgi:MFS family permease